MKMPINKNNPPVYCGSKINASDLTTINNHLKNLVQQNNWQKAMAGYVCNNLRGRLIKTFGMALCLVHADNRIKSNGKANQGLLLSLMRELGTSKSEGYALKRAGEILVTLMDDPILWQKFVTVQLPKTTIYKLNTLEDACDQYLKTTKSNSDKEAFIKEINDIHEKTYDQIRQANKRASKKNTRAITPSGGTK